MLVGLSYDWWTGALSLYLGDIVPSLRSICFAFLGGYDSRAVVLIFVRVFSFTWSFYNHHTLQNCKTRTLLQKSGLESLASKVWPQKSGLVHRPDQRYSSAVCSRLPGISIPT